MAYSFIIRFYHLTPEDIRNLEPKQFEELYKNMSKVLNWENGVEVKEPDYEALAKHIKTGKQK